MIWALFEDRWHFALAEKPIFLFVGLHTGDPPSFEAFRSLGHVDLPTLFPDLGKQLGTFLVGLGGISEGIAYAEKTIFTGNILAKLMESFEELEMGDTEVRCGFGGRG